jgi:hypothetical protein
MKRACLTVLCAFSLSFAADEAGLPVLTTEDLVNDAVSQSAMDVNDRSMERLRAIYEARVPELKRLFKLDESRMKLLRVAVEGTQELQMQSVRGSILREMEERTKNADPRTLNKFLLGINSTWSGSSADAAKLWKAVIKQVLTEDEVKRLNEVEQARKVYRERAIALLLQAIVKERVGLSVVQAEKLKPLLTKAVADYLPDLLQYFNSGERSIYSQYIPMMALGVKEADVKAVLADDAKWEAWKGLPGQYADTWEYVKKQHDRRVEQEKKGAKP